ncbi:beta-L-arabinofuranosidase domain-containing protein [Sporolactobacillus shoreicorticis]|uniref:Beta-L-arabinofuranosidase domain-containing protein n=1 Tax=Sporolactobacillus shoreicorticis TaxID=1923877 RepID=A0ABW5S002_9BACL
MTDSEIIRAQTNTVNYLLKLEPERFLHEMYKVAGLEPPTEEGYQGWERSDRVNFRGHFFGHYISALAQAVDVVSDCETQRMLMDKLHIAIEGIAAAQTNYAIKHPEHCGYVSAFREVALDEVEGRDVSVDQKENVLVPWYCLHKIFAGLIDTHEAVNDRDPVLSSVALDAASATNCLASGFPVLKKTLFSHLTMKCMTSGMASISQSNRLTLPTHQKVSPK